MPPGPACGTGSVFGAFDKGASPGCGVESLVSTQVKSAVLSRVSCGGGEGSPTPWPGGWPFWGFVPEPLPVLVLGGGSRLGDLGCAPGRGSLHAGLRHVWQDGSWCGVLQEGHQRVCAVSGGAGKVAWQRGLRQVVQVGLLWTVAQRTQVRSSAWGCPFAPLVPLRPFPLGGGWYPCRCPFPCPHWGGAWYQTCPVAGSCSQSVPWLRPHPLVGNPILGSRCALWCDCRRCWELNTRTMVRAIERLVRSRLCKALSGRRNGLVVIVVGGVGVGGDRGCRYSTRGVRPESVLGQQAARLQTCWEANTVTWKGTA